MDKKAKEAIENIKKQSVELLSESILMTCIPDRNAQIVNFLVASGYLEETRRMKANRVEITMYRLTSKGLTASEPFYKKIWPLIKRNAESIMVAAITALIVSIINNWLIS